MIPSPSFVNNMTNADIDISFDKTIAYDIHRKNLFDRKKKLSYPLRSPI